jgi:hypothetical protein
MAVGGNIPITELAAETGHDADAVRAYLQLDGETVPARLAAVWRTVAAVRGRVAGPVEGGLG